MPRVKCLSCGDVDTVEQPEDAGPMGDWECGRCGWHTARPVD